MKKALFVFIILTTLFVPKQAPAGFWINQHSISYSSPVSDSTRKVAAHERTRSERIHKNTTSPGHQLPGWPGILSLIFGILGFYPYFAIAAIILGIIGLNKNHKHRGMALAGLILGAVFLAVELVLVILLAGM